MRYKFLHSQMLRTIRRYCAVCSGCLLALGLIFITGCGSETAKKTAAEAEHHDGDGHKAGEAGHAHAEEGPHHGHLIELGKEEYHAELTHDDATHKVTIYLLDGAVKKSVAIAENELTLNLVVDGKPLQFKLPAVPQVDDPAGQSSRFELADQALCDGWDAPKSTGRLNIMIGGKQFSGNLSHEGHADHK